MIRSLYRFNVKIHKNYRKYSELLQHVRSKSRCEDIAIIDSIPSIPIASNSQTNPKYTLSQGNDLKMTGIRQSYRMMNYQQLYTEAKSLAIYIKTTYDVAKISSIGAYISHHHNNEKMSDYVIVMLAAWILQKVFVPLCLTHPVKEIEYFVQDSNIGLIVHNILNEELFRKSIINQISNENVIILDINRSHSITIPDREYAKNLPGEVLQPIDPKIANHENSIKDHALVLYTSGTTGKPKGVLHTHSGLNHMIKGLVQAWKYSKEDVILHFLPLHHLHGVLNKLLCMLYAGGMIHFIKSPAAVDIWQALASYRNSAIKKPSFKKSSSASSLLSSSNNESIEKPILPTLFMAVPTVYGKLIESSKNLSEDIRQPALDVLKQMRLHVSGSAALPDVIMDAWKDLTGHTLLERYGMTELGD